MLKAIINWIGDWLNRANPFHFYAEEEDRAYERAMSLLQEDISKSAGRHITREQILNAGVRYGKWKENGSRDSPRGSCDGVAGAVHASLGDSNSSGGGRLLCSGKQYKQKSMRRKR